MTVGRKRAAAIGCAVIAVVTTAKLAFPQLSDTATAVSFDAYQRLSPREKGDAPVRVVDIDEASLSTLGQWPWPRTTLAKLTERLAELGAAAVAFDVILAEPDSSSPRTFAASLPITSEQDRERLQEILAPLPDHDEVFATAMRKVPIVLGFAATPHANDRRPRQRPGLVFAGRDPRTILPPFPGTVTALPRLEEAAAGEGSVSLSANDRGGVVRRAPMLFTDGRDVYLGLALEALRVAQGATSATIRATGASGESEAGGAPAIVDVKVGAVRVPLTADGELWLRFDRDRPDRYVSAAAVVASGSASLREKLDGHIVFVGSSAAGLLDIRATPLGENVPGVSVHAQAAEQILEGNFIRRPDWADGLELAATVLFCALVVVLLLLLDASLAFGVITAVMLAITGTAWWAFIHGGFLFEPIIPSLSAGIVFSAMLGVLYFTGDREKRFIRQAFSQYLVPELVQKLEEAPHSLKLGGETKSMSIMFMDIRGFTPISESLTADELVTFLNQLLSPLSDAILHEDGTIDKYIGDSIMAFWNAPVPVEDHALHACRAALAMRTTLHAMNDSDAFGFEARGLAAVRIGVGVNTGQACVGNVGSTRRFNYSVVGDAVNVAARIEASSKDIGSDILVSEATATAAPSLAFLEAGRVELKGKSENVRLFALVGDEALAVTPRFVDLRGQHATLLERLSGDEEEGVRDLLDRCRELGGAPLAAFYDRFEEKMRRHHWQPA